MKIKNYFILLTQINHLFTHHQLQVDYSLIQTYLNKGELNRRMALETEKEI